MVKKEILEQIKNLGSKVDKLTLMVNKLQSKKQTINKDGLPLSSNIFADVEKVGKVILAVKRQGYKVKEINHSKIIEGKEFKSLSAAAEAFSNIKRKSGWIFWRDCESGRTLKNIHKG